MSASENRSLLAIALLLSLFLESAQASTDVCSGEPIFHCSTEKAEVSLCHTGSKNGPLAYVAKSAADKNSKPLVISDAAQSRFTYAVFDEQTANYSRQVRVLIPANSYAYLVYSNESTQPMVPAAEGVVVLHNEKVAGKYPCISAADGTPEFYDNPLVQHNPSSGTASNLNEIELPAHAWDTEE